MQNGIMEHWNQGKAQNLSAISLIVFHSLFHHFIIPIGNGSGIYPVHQIPMHNTKSICL